MKIRLALVAAALATAGGAHAQSIDDLMKKYACNACHAVDKKLVGPPYKEVAAKYRGNPKAAELLFKKVKEGGVGVWGQIPMPPNAAVPDADIKLLVADILKLK
jgi:cytochrome c